MMRLGLTLGFFLSALSGASSVVQDEPAEEGVGSNRGRQGAQRVPGALEPPPPDTTQPGDEPTDVSESPSTVSVLRGRDLRNLGVRFLTDGLRSAPGLEVQRLSSSESNVTMRGYNDDTSAAQGILALVDGRSVYNEFFGSVLWDTLPVALDDIKSVAVVRGPSSFLYGPNAMHGLVNIETKSPLDYEDNELYVSGSYGSYQSVLGSLIYVRREGDTAFKAKIVRDDINEFDPRDDNAKDKTFFEGRFETEFESGHRLGLTGGINQQKFNVLIPTFAGLPSAQFLNEVQEPYLKLDYAWGGLKTKVSWSQFDALGDPEAVYTPFHVISDTADADLQYSRTLAGRHEVTLGTGYRFASFETDDQDVSNGRHKTGLAWVFVQDQFEAVEGTLWMTGGLRIDSHSVTGGSYSPRLAAVLRVAEDQNVRVSAGYGFRNPSLRELWFGMPVLGGAGIIIGNKNLDPERIRSFELSYWGRPTPKFQLTANVYYNRIDDLVEFRALNPTTFGPLNVFDEEAYGFELGAEYQFLEPLWGFANYTWGVRRDRDTHKKNPMAPRHKANAGFRFRLYRERAAVKPVAAEPNDGALEPPPPLADRRERDAEDREESFTAMIWGTFFDDIDFIDTASAMVVGSTDEYFMLSGRVSWRLPIERMNGRVFVQAFNLLDHDHREQPPGDPYGLILTAGVEATW